MPSLKFPVWMIVPASALEIADPLELATFKNGPAKWVCLTRKGVPHALVFTSLQKAQAFAAKNPRPQDYVNAELSVMEFCLAIKTLIAYSIDQLLIDGRTVEIAPLLATIEKLPQSRPDFEQP